MHKSELATWFMNLLIAVCVQVERDGQRPTREPRMLAAKTNKSADAFRMGETFAHLEAVPLEQRLDSGEGNSRQKQRCVAQVEARWTYKKWRIDVSMLTGTKPWFPDICKEILEPKQARLRRCKASFFW